MKNALRGVCLQRVINYAVASLILVLAASVSGCSTSELSLNNFWQEVQRQGNIVDEQAVAAPRFLTLEVMELNVYITPDNVQIHMHSWMPWLGNDSSYKAMQVTYGYFGDKHEWSINKDIPYPPIGEVDITDLGFYRLDELLQAVDSYGLNNIFGDKEGPVRLSLSIGFSPAAGEHTYGISQGSLVETVELREGRYWVPILIVENPRGSGRQTTYLLTDFVREAPDVKYFIDRFGNNEPIWRLLLGTDILGF